MFLSPGRTWTLALLAQVACGISPVPEPPIQAKPAIVELPTGSSCVGCVDSQPKFDGAPGSTTSTKDLWVANLDSSDEAMVVPVQPDGSYGFSLRITSGQELRLVARSAEGLLSAPLDLAFSTGAPVARAPRPYEACLTFPTESKLAPSSDGNPQVTVLALENRCGFSVRVGKIAFRRPVSGLSIEATAAPPPDLASGQTVNVRVTGSSADPGQELVLVEIVAPERDRRAVMLRY